MMNTLKLLWLGIGVMTTLAIQAQTAPLVDVSIIEGEWKLDMSPQNLTDNNFAQMKITKASTNGLEGEFYRDGVKMQEGRVNTQMGIIYGALVSGDNSGSYNTTFYYKEGKLYGTTHSIDKDFLAVWVATKK